MNQCQIFSPAEVASFRRGGSILRGCLEAVSLAVRPGVTTASLDAIAEEYIRSHQGAEPAFKGFQGFPGTLCTSVNEECVHGIPGERELKDGDILSIDCGVRYDGLYTDACITVPVGTINADAKKILTVTAEALEQVLPILQAGVRVGDISSSIQQYAETNGCKALRALTGHGLGETLHQFPDIPNVGEAGKGPKLPANTVIAIEPILSLGSDQVIDADDGWTLAVKDGALSAHFEHTILITDDGHEVIA